MVKCCFRCGIFSNTLRKQFANSQPASSDIDTNDEEPFTEFHSTWSIKKRWRETPPHTAKAVGVNQSTAKVKHGPLIVGKSVTSGNSGIILIDKVNPLRSQYSALTMYIYGVLH